jgi:hypothetical protein
LHDLNIGVERAQTLADDVYELSAERSRAAEEDTKRRQIVLFYG